MEKQDKDKMIDFIISNKIKLGSTLQDIIQISDYELAKPSLDEEEFQFHKAVKEEASARLRKETRMERFPEVNVRSTKDEWNESTEEEYWKHESIEYVPSLSEEEIMKMLQDEYDRSAYLDLPTDNIDL